MPAVKIGDKHDAKGDIPLYEATLELGDPLPGSKGFATAKEFEFTVATNDGKKFPLRATSAQVRTTWVDLITPLGASSGAGAEAAPSSGGAAEDDAFSRPAPALFAPPPPPPASAPPPPSVTPSYTPPPPISSLVAPPPISSVAPPPPVSVAAPATEEDEGRVLTLKERMAKLSTAGKGIVLPGMASPAPQAAPPQAAPAAASYADGLRAQLASLEVEKKAAIAAEDYPRAAAVKEEADRVTALLQKEFFKQEGAASDCSDL